MLGWSSPLRTSISPHTASSFPLTFFLGMTLSATSFVTPDDFADEEEPGRDGVFPFPFALSLSLPSASGDPLVSEEK